jgi:hypothetical protein
MTDLFQWRTNKKAAQTHDASRAGKATEEKQQKIIDDLPA